MSNVQFFFHQFAISILSKKNFVTYLGFEKSHLAVEVYQTTEQENVNLIKKLKYYVAIIMVLMFSIPISMPIIFILFGTFGPETWFLPFTVV